MRVLSQRLYRKRRSKVRKLHCYRRLAIQEAAAEPRRCNRRLSKEETVNLSEVSSSIIIKHSARSHLGERVANQRSSMSDALRGSVKNSRPRRRV